MSYPFAIVALVAGVVSLFLNLFLIPSIVAVIFGVVGIRHDLSHRTPEGGKRKAEGQGSASRLPG